MAAESLVVFPLTLWTLSDLLAGTLLILKIAPVLANTVYGRYIVGLIKRTRLSAIPSKSFVKVGMDTPDHKSPALTIAKLQLPIAIPCRSNQTGKIPPIVRSRLFATAISQNTWNVLTIGAKSDLGIQNNVQSRTQSVRPIALRNYYISFNIVLAMAFSISVVFLGTERWK